MFDVRLDIYDDAGQLLPGDNQIVIAPSIGNPDWTADFDGDAPEAAWSANWSQLGTDFLTLEFYREDSADELLGRYVYVPTALAYGAGETDFYRPEAETGPAEVLFEVSVDPSSFTAGVRARNGAWGVAGGAAFEDVIGQRYVVPYNHAAYASACSASCPDERRPGYFLARLPDGAPRPTASTQRYVFSDSTEVVILPSWGTNGVLAWDVANLELRFPEGRRLIVEGALDATDVTLTEAVTDEGWGGVVFREGSGGVAGASALTDVTVEKVRREVPQGGFALPKGAVEVAGREVVLDDTDVVSSVGGITGLLVSGSAAEVTVTGGSVIQGNTGGGVYASGGAEVTVSDESAILLNTGGAGVTASGYGTLVHLEGATVSGNVGVGVRALSQGLVRFASDDSDPFTTVQENAGGLDAGGGGSLNAGVCAANDPAPCPGRTEHFIVDNAVTGPFDAQSLGGSYVTAQGNDWDVGHLDDLELDVDASSTLVVCPLVGAAGCGVDGLLGGGAGRRGGGEVPLRIEDVLALVDEAERARMAGDMAAFDIAASAVVAAIDTSGTEEERRAAFEVTSRLFAWAQPAAPLSALEGLAEEAGDGKPWALRALGVAYASAEEYEDARAVADTLVSAYAGSEHARFGHGLAVRVAVAEEDEAAAVAALVALASAWPEAEEVGALAALVIGTFPDADLSALGGGEAAPRGQASATTSGTPRALLAVGEARPNPSSSRASVPFELAAEAQVEAVLYDVLGRRLAVLASGHYTTGRHALTFEGSHLPSGVYVVYVTARAGTGAPASAEGPVRGVAVRRLTLTR